MKYIFLVFSVLSGITSFGQRSIDADSLMVTKRIQVMLKTATPPIENDSLKFLKGEFFNAGITHKYIRYSTFSGVYIQIYSSQDNYKKPIFSDQIGPLNFVSDSLFDINGDKVTDLAIHWYPSSGCCLADVFDCYLYDQEKDVLSTKHELLNPTFYAERSEVYTMSYGRPGSTTFFRLNWNKHQADTTMSYSWNNVHHEYLSVKDFITGQKKKFKELPKELNGLYGIGWFLTEPNSPEDH